MKRTTRMPAKRVVVLAMGLVLALGGFALSGCGGGSDDAGAEDAGEPLEEATPLEGSDENDASFNDISSMIGTLTTGEKRQGPRTRIRRRKRLNRQTDFSIGSSQRQRIIARVKMGS